jgi:large conductance mechanosensitive channel
VAGGDAQGKSRYSGGGKDGRGTIMIGEFKAFIARGNVLDLAVAVIIGAAFATIVTSLTDDMIMPLVGAVFGNMDFSNQFILLGAVPEGYSGPMTYAALKEAGVPMLGWGQFLTTLVNFLILAFIIFLLIRAATRATRKADEGDAGPGEDVLLLREIRDSLKQRT